MNQKYLEEAILKVGSSFYFYDLDGFREHMRSIKEMLDPGIKVWYACKANPLSSILRVLKEEGFGLDVASTGELRAARAVGLKGSELIATGPAKSRNYLATLLQHEVGTIIAESYNQLKDLNELCGRLKRKQRVLLRVQFETPFNDQSVLGGNDITPFGLGPDDWSSLRLTDYPHLHFVGLHSFQWSNVLSVEELKSRWEYTILEGKKLCYALGLSLEIFDLGGGLGISYQDSRQLFFEQVHETLKELKLRFELPQLWLELGRYSMAEFGSYLTRIIDIKSVRGKRMIITEGGINHMARPALVGESFPCRSLKASGGTVPYAIHGPLCTSLDKLGEYYLPENLRPGDWLIFEKTGAYGLTESMPFFLCHDLPGEVIQLQNELKVVRTPQAALDWMV